MALIYKEAMRAFQRKFKSHNGVAVTRISMTAEEYSALTDREDEEDILLYYRRFRITSPKYTFATTKRGVQESDYY